MKMLLLAAVTAAGGSLALSAAGVLPCPCELASCAADRLGLRLELRPELSEPTSPKAAPSGLYLEARDATVWGGACHISAQADTLGKHAVCGWAFEAGSHAGVDLTGVRVVAAVQGERNLQAHRLFRVGEAPRVTSIVWIDAPTAAGAKVRTAVLDFLASTSALGEVAAVHEADVLVRRVGDTFELSARRPASQGAGLDHPGPAIVEPCVSVRGEALADRSCCTMPESRWYEPLVATSGSVVGVPSACYVEGEGDTLERWRFEGQNSAFVARFGA